MFVEKKIAKSLFSDIKIYFENFDIKPIIELDGDGVHWNCVLKMDEYEASIYSCDISYHPDEKGRTEEFIVSYIQKREEVSCGRTSNRDKLIKSVEIWLNYKSKEQLYNKFEFVDHDLRFFQKQESDWIYKFPELGRTSRILEYQGSGTVRYEISYDDRSCWSTGIGEKGEAYFGFSWDGCTLFETETIREETAEVLKRYLIDKETLSFLNKEFSNIPTNNLTECYEKGEGIKGEFVESWNSILQFYADFPEKWLPCKNEIIMLIHGLIDQGFDQTIRAGKSWTKLILSRSRRHGLSEDSPFVAFEFWNNKIQITTGKGEIVELNSIQIDQRILGLIKELENKEIN